MDIFPACTPAVHSDESSVYTLVPHTEAAVPFAGQRKVNGVLASMRNLVREKFHGATNGAFVPTCADVLGLRNAKLFEKIPKKLVLTPLRRDPLNPVCEANMRTITLPPLAIEIIPACTAAPHTPLSAV